MTSTDLFEATQKIADALSGLSESEIKKSLLMAIIAVDKVGILIDPSEIMTRTVSASVPKCCDDCDDEEKDVNDRPD
jgi:hypothetical protein